MRLAAGLTDRNAWAKVRRAELRYGTALRKIARHIGDFASTLNLEDPAGRAQFADAMDQYSRALTPWATAAGSRMLNEVDRRDSQAWETYTRQMGRALQREVQDTPTGMIFRTLLNDQVGLITSLPTEAAQRVQDIATKAIFQSTRPEVISQQLAATGQVTKHRANTIARTEVSRAGTTFLGTRAQAVGSTQYIWRVTRDGRLRESHAHMADRVCEWASPPVVEPQNAPYHPGCIYNCRCHAEPILPDDW